MTRLSLLPHITDIKVSRRVEIQSSQVWSRAIATISFYSTSKLLDNLCCMSQLYMRTNEKFA